MTGHCGAGPRLSRARSCSRSRRSSGGRRGARHAVARSHAPRACWYAPALPKAARFNFVSTSRPYGRSRANKTGGEACMSAGSRWGPRGVALLILLTVLLVSSGLSGLPSEAAQVTAQGGGPARRSEPHGSRGYQQRRHRRYPGLRPLAPALRAAGRRQPRRPQPGQHRRYPGLWHLAAELRAAGPHADAHRRGDELYPGRRDLPCQRVGGAARECPYRAHRAW
jgi:hypothetical protein